MAKPIKEGSIYQTGPVRLANSIETAAGVSERLAVTPAGLAAAVDDLVQHATTTDYGIVTLTDNSFPVATKVYVDAIAIAGAPVASETTAGIAEIATAVETVAYTDDARIVTPLKLADAFAAPPALGSGTPAAGTFTDLTASGGAVSLTSTGSAGLFDVTGAGIDLTLSSDAGRVVVNGEEAADDALRLVSAAGGLDLDVALSCVLTTSETNADSMQLVSAGGIDITATGAAGKDIDIVNTNGSVNITAGESGADAIVLSASIGGIQINAPSAAAGEDIALTATGSSIKLVSTENAGDAIYLESTAGGVQILASGAAAGEDIVITATGSSVKITATENAADSIVISSSNGGIDILAPSAAAGEDIDIVATGSSINIQATESDVNAIVLNASGAAGGINVDSGTSGFICDSTGAISLDSAAASNFTVTGAFDLTLSSSAGSVNLSAGEAAADALNFDAAAGGLDVDVALQMNLNSAQAAADAIRIYASDAAGGIDVDCGTGGFALDSTGALSLDGVASSNFTVTGAAADATVQSVGGSVNILASEAAANAVRIYASDAAGGIDVDCGSGGFLVDAASGAVSLDSALASNFTVTGAADLTLSSSAGAVNVTSGEANADSINITSGGGMNIVATGAAAKDVVLTCTSGSMTLTAGENVTDALNLTASGAASRINLSAGTGSIKFASGWVVPVTTKSNADTPYSVLGTDYLIDCDTTAGVLTVTLPAATALAGRTFVIRDGAGTAAVNNITINGGGTNLVGGGAAAATKTLSAAYSGATVYSNGTVWLYAAVV